MKIVSGLVGLAIGIMLARLLLRGRSGGAASASPQHEQELKAILDEVRELRLEIDILKVNPTIGGAVKAALDHARNQADFEKSAYDVAVRSGRIPASAYNVAVMPVRQPGEDSAERS